MGGRPAGLVRRSDGTTLAPGERWRCGAPTSGLPHPAGRRRLLRPHAAEAALGRSLRRREGALMLTELRVRDLATIADVTLPLGPASTCSPARPGRGSRCWSTRSRCCWASARPSGSVRPGAARRWSKARSRGSTRATRRADRGARARRGGRPRRGAARGLRRGPLPRLGERQPHHRGRARRSSARCWWISTASTRPSRCCTPTRSARSSMPSPTPEPERSAVAEAHAALAAAPGGGVWRSRAAGTRCAAGPTTSGTW